MNKLLKSISSVFNRSINPRKLVIFHFILIRFLLKIFTGVLPSISKTKEFILNAYINALKNTFKFSGRATRSDYWFFVLTNIFVFIGFNIIDSVAGLRVEQTGVGITTSIYNLLILLPSISVAARRLHDTDRTGWWMLITLIPVIGLLALVVLLALPSDEGHNSYGPSPFENKRISHDQENQAA